jgi:hypothetical protein
MSDLWFLGNADPSAWNGGEGPDPVTPGDTGWTWDLEFITNSNQWTYARTSLNSFANIGGGSGYVDSGIVQYRTRDSKGVDSVHPVGQSGPNGLADFMNDMGVDSVTFGWTIGADNYCHANINMEVWVSG